ncbi:hypothetical protein V1525DRAFT_388072 [Lipomyces kononenkoae]|uniref:Uncharacterized protein n=1 Tax=Lipomyces kononenkoae TaxID=34357 RepID=A0ACC3T1Y9_LIPKO
MSRHYFALDYSSTAQHQHQHQFEPEMLLFASSTPSPSDYASFVDQFSLTASPATMSPTAAYSSSPFDTITAAAAAAAPTSSFQPLDNPIESSPGLASISSIASFNPRMFVSSSMLDDTNNSHDGGMARSAPAFTEFQFRPQSSSISTTSEPSPSSSSAQSPPPPPPPYAAVSIPASASLSSSSGGRLNPKRPPQARRPNLTSSRSAPAVAQCLTAAPVAAAVGPTKNAAGKFQCNECSRSYLHAKHLKRHMLRHTGDRPYKCSLCSDSFCRSDILKRHFEKCQHRRANAAKAAAAAGVGRVVAENSAAAADNDNDNDNDNDSNSTRSPEPACDECVRAGLRCGREDGHVCLRCGQLGSPCSVAGRLVDEPLNNNLTPSPPRPAPATAPGPQLQLQHQHEYFPKPQIDDESTTGVFTVSTEFQHPLVQPHSNMYDFNLLSYYPDMVEAPPVPQVHVQSPMQFYA